MSLKMINFALSNIIDLILPRDYEAMNLNELYQRFQSWQQDPFHYGTTADKHICANCGTEFTGNYCPVCGQSYHVGHVTWSSVGQEIIKAWGFESQSFFSSLLQLLGRPGYLISDYINGRQKVCCSPISMLFLLAIIVMLYVN